MNRGGDMSQLERHRLELQDMPPNDIGIHKNVSSEIRTKEKYILRKIILKKIYVENNGICK